MGVGVGCQGGGIQDGHGGWHCPPLDGTEDPGREKREGGHREAGPGPAHQARPPSAWGVGEGMEGAHGTQMGVGARRDN